MDPIRPVSSPPPIPAVDPVIRAADTAERGDDRRLEPAVSVDIGSDRRAETERRGFERDRDSKSVVYRVTDTVSGDVIVQIPNEIVIKARVYGREQTPPVGELIAKRA